MKKILVAGLLVLFSSGIAMADRDHSRGGKNWNKGHHSYNYKKYRGYGNYNRGYGYGRGYNYGPRYNPYYYRYGPGYGYGRGYFGPGIGFSFRF